jgi:hypothetical protein
MLAGDVTAEEPRLQGERGGRRVWGTDRPHRPCDTWRCRVVEAFWEEPHGQRGADEPCAARGTNVAPRAVACWAMPVTVRARYGASEASRPCWTSALPCCHRRETRRARVWAAAVRAVRVPRRACIRRKQAPQARCA